jgi:hypothetical protein
MKSNRRNYWFDRPALYQAIDEQRIYRQLSWTEVAREIGVAAGTLKATANKGHMETDGMLAMVRWLGCAPERFFRSRYGLPTYEPPAQKEFRRLNTKALFAALNVKRQDKGFTWQELASEIGPQISASMLTRLANGGRIRVGLMVPCVCWLHKTVNDFTHIPPQKQKQ